MGTNIEIKARAGDLARLKTVAESLSGSPEQLIEQEDIFFHAPQGRLKLRIFSSGEGELIYYERAEVAGPKQSRYEIIPTSDPLSVRAVLTAALGIRGVVRKKRHLFLVDQTRIHLDEVEGLGNFVELEVVLNSGQSAAEGEAIARGLMDRLQIEEEDLIDAAYIDLLELNEGTSA